MIQLIEQKIINHLEVVIFVLYLQQYKPCAQNELHLGYEQYHFGQNNLYSYVFCDLG